MLKKAKYYLKTKGALPTLALVLRTLYSAARRAVFAALLYGRWLLCGRALSRQLQGKTVLVVTPTVEWGYLFARAQQMAACFGRREGCLAIYLSRQDRYDNVCGWKQVREGVILANAALAKRLDACAKDAFVITAVYDLTKAELRTQYRSDRLVYEYVDELRLIVSPAEEFAPWQARHVELLGQADLSVATASRLYEQILPHANKALLLPNAVDYDFFAAKTAPRGDLAALGRPYTCVLGYYGALAPWFDYEAVLHTAQAHPDWLWLLIGSTVGSALEDSGILSLPNVKHLPAVPYESLPACIAAMDILTVPFVQNEITEATSPVKLFEYMAAGKPVIAADLPECRKYPPVLRYRQPEVLEQLVPQALALGDDPDYRAQLQRLAQENTWDARCEAECAALGLSHT